MEVGSLTSPGMVNGPGAQERLAGGMNLTTGGSLSSIFDDVIEDTRPYKCDVPGCGKSFVKNNFLEFHIRTHTDELPGTRTRIRPFQCEVEGCDSSYTRSWHLTRHVKNAHQPKSPVREKFPCTVDGCSRTYQSVDALKKHQAGAHAHDDKLTSVKYHCSICRVSFTKHNKLRVHMSQHSGEMPFKCGAEGCGKEYRVQSKLKAHEKSHAGYSCDICENQKFITWSALRKHCAEAHSSKRCSKCDRTFKKNALLLAHLQTHLEDRPAFVCPVAECDKSYFEMKNLRAHQRAAHENIRFACTECGKEFCSKQSLRRHGRKCLTKVQERKASKTGNERKTRVDKGLPRKTAAEFLSAVDKYANESSSLIDYPCT